MRAVQYVRTVLTPLALASNVQGASCTCVQCNVGTLYPRLHDLYSDTVSLHHKSHLKADSHSMSCPCHPTKGLECVFPIWFTQCGHVWFTLPTPCSDHAVLLKATAQHGHREMACGLPACVHLLLATMRSSTKVVIRSIPVLLTTIHTYNCKEW